MTLSIVIILIIVLILLLYYYFIYYNLKKELVSGDNKLVTMKYITTSIAVVSILGFSGVLVHLFDDRISPENLKQGQINKFYTSYGPNLMEWRGKTRYSTHNFDSINNSIDTLLLSDDSPIKGFDSKKISHSFIQISYPKTIADSLGKAKYDTKDRDFMSKVIPVTLSTREDTIEALKKYFLNRESTAISIDTSGIPLSHPYRLNSGDFLNTRFNYGKLCPPDCPDSIDIITIILDLYENKDFEGLKYYEKLYKIEFTK